MHYREGSMSMDALYLVTPLPDIQLTIGFRYWALAGPAFLCTAFLYYLVACVSLGLSATPPLNSMNNLTGEIGFTTLILLGACRVLTVTACNFCLVLADRSTGRHWGPCAV